jgi:predicted RNase H-like HicB family nuclease
MNGGDQPAMRYTILLEECEEGGYTATCPALPGCISEGDTYQEALENIKDAIQLYLRAIAKEIELLQQQKSYQLAEVVV